MGGPVYTFDIIRLPHYSMHPGRSSMEWIVRVVRFHGRSLVQRDSHCIE
jgi:hypothetical protein